MKVLITGGAGFIGSYLVDRLVTNNYDVVVIDNLSTGKLENVNSKATFYKENIVNEENIIDIFKKEKPDIVFHLAGQSSVSKSAAEPSKDCYTNILGTVNILKASVDTKVKKIVYSSTAAVYGNPEKLPIDESHKVEPVSFYGISKLCGETYIKKFSSLYGIQYTILRYANVYGGRQRKDGEGGVISIFFSNMLKGKKSFIFGDGSFTRDFIYVDDVVNANICAIDKSKNEVFNIGTGKKTAILELFNIMQKIVDTDVQPQFESIRYGDISHSYFNIKRAEKLLKWKPIYSLEEGLKKTLDYYR